MQPNWRANISRHDDLVTKPDAIRDGFLKQALAKVDKAAGFVDEALEFWSALQAVKEIESLLGQSQLRNALIAAAGFSDKARNYMTAAELDAAVEAVLAKITPTDSSTFREEIYARYLLTKGDALGGQMRNWTGAMAAQQLSAALLRQLSSLSPTVQTDGKKTNKVQAITWDRRLLVFDRKPKFINKNIDVILLTGPEDRSATTQLLETPDYYIACGELKGGIDPAGADEHWKTASSALQRIRAVSSFDKQPPKLFFVGAAIARGMAKEIYDQLVSGQLQFAANLTSPRQVQALVAWLAEL